MVVVPFCIPVSLPSSCSSTTSRSHHTTQPTKKSSKREIGSSRHGSAGYPEEKSKDFSKKKKYSRILTDDKNVDRTFSRNTKMSTGHLVENQNIDRNNIEGSKI